MLSFIYICVLNQSYQYAVIVVKTIHVHEPATICAVLSFVFQILLHGLSTWYCWRCKSHNQISTIEFKYEFIFVARKNGIRWFELWTKRMKSRAEGALQWQWIAFNVSHCAEKYDKIVSMVNRARRQHFTFSINSISLLAFIKSSFDSLLYLLQLEETMIIMKKIEKDRKKEKENWRIKLAHFLYQEIYQYIRIYFSNT